MENQAKFRSQRETRMNVRDDDSPFIVGILGSGQLGRMLAIAAAQLGIRTHVYAPDAKNSPAGEIAHSLTTGEYDDNESLKNFASKVNVITSEFENVPATTMKLLSNYCPMSPGYNALHTAQHRIREKTMARALGIETPLYWHVKTATELKGAMRDLGQQGILKTCTLGYDGKGQVRVKPDDDLDITFEQLHTNDAILEEIIDFSAEASFLIARDATGNISHFPASLNKHQNGILMQSNAPASINDDIKLKGQKSVEKFAKELKLFGLLTLEAFITADGKLLFNEIAPRPHNSFHWTIEGCATSQFTQLARLLSGQPLGATHVYGKWQMNNLIGNDVSKVHKLLESPGTHVHLYGKDEAKPGRKMGHTNSLLVE